MRSSLAVAITVCGVVLAACGGSPSSASVTLPPPGASASLVLDTYLRALVAGDCATAHALAAPSFSYGNGELCGDVKVSAYSPPRGPATPARNMAEFASELTTGGSSDGSIESGKTVWFYQLKRHDGQWRLVSGGSGP